ncbi:MAG TPA: porin [Steroidobacteraceae bacterium]|jgi:phosphate-selective porin OprO/OprP|nr:porin [Steroidobacteraceae bacterium]
MPRRLRSGYCIGAAGALFCLLASAATAQAPSDDPSIDNTIDAAEAEGVGPRRQLVRWNEYEGPYFTARLGGGFLVDAVAYEQDAESREQGELSSDTGLRDFRFLLKGKLKFSPRLSYSIGYMYDGNQEVWRFRQTGIMVDVPEGLGNVFIGRQKEGFSTNKIMVGYSGWTQERSTASDSFIPILADGVKWTGTVPSGKFVYNVGWFRDRLSENESFDKNDQQVIARAVWLPFTGKEPGKLLHLAVEARYGESDNGTLQFRSKPESFLAQRYVLDTGKIPATHSNMLGLESYFRRGPMTLGMEWFFNQVYSPETGDPLFHGGEVLFAYLLTGEVRRYNAKGAFFEGISPARPVFAGGPGAWELVLRYSYTSLDSASVHGGTFWRLTPMVNWHMSDNVRLELSYGYGEERSEGLRGGTQFFQARLQLQL